MIVISVDIREQNQYLNAVNGLQLGPPTGSQTAQDLCKYARQRVLSRIWNHVTLENSKRTCPVCNHVKLKADFWVKSKIMLYYIERTCSICSDKKIKIFLASSKSKPNTRHVFQVWENFTLPLPPSNDVCSDSKTISNPQWRRWPGLMCCKKRHWGTELLNGNYPYQN